MFMALSTRLARAFERVMRGPHCSDDSTGFKASSRTSTQQSEEGMAEHKAMPQQVAAVWVSISELKPWKDNPRKNAHAVGKVAESIERFGFGTPIVARRADGQVIAGHTRLLAAEKLGLTEVPVRFLDLDPVDARLLAMADNKLSELAEWDEDLLGKVLAELKAANAELSATGFAPAEIDALLAQLTAANLQDIQEDPIPEPPEHPESTPGAIYQLGEHLLLCGDSSDQQAVADLLGERRADLLFTDPPYGVSYQSHMSEGGTATRFRRIENDDLTPAELQKFLDQAFRSAARVLRPGAALYVCHANQKPGIYGAFEAALLSQDFHIAACIAWVKPSATMGWQDYRNRYEPILYGWRKGADRRKVEDRTETNVWEIGRDAAAAYEHPTQKPVELPLRAIRNSTGAGETVLDLFGGSGSTLIAAAKSGRRAILVEKDPAYCDVIRQRWERLIRKVSP
jgi:site-specific DNA-methyltransferase (adenine-specific)